MDRVQRGGTATRALLASVIVMGVLIVAGVAVLGITIVRRMGSAAASGPLMLDEPAGTRIVSASAAGDRVAVLLQGGGPDRVVLLDAHSGRAVGQVVLRVAGP